MENLPGLLRSAAANTAALGATAADIEALDPAGLRAALDVVTTLRRCADRYAALVAAAIAHQSRPDSGHWGVAQAAGFVSPVAMLQSTAGISRQDAVKLVQVGTMIAETEARIALESAPDARDLPADRDPDAAPSDRRFLPLEPSGWQAPLTDALSSGALSMDAVESIRRGFGDIDPALPAEFLVAAVQRVVATSAGLTAEQVYRRARQARDVLDEAGIERREKERRDLRSVRSWWDAAGMYCGSWRLPPEEGMIVASAIDDVLSPRRGGPRFIDPAAGATAEQMLNDERSTEQVVADAVVDMVRLAVDADPGKMFGRRRPTVRVIVTQQHLENRAGHGRIEGHPDPVSFLTIERHLCDTGTVGIAFDDDGQCVNVGRDHRLFTERQRVGMTVRDGGCRFPGCDRPPSYCEAHHVHHWYRDDGETNIADGILLCRRHHLLIHNNRWQVDRDRGAYWLTPPATVDPTRTRIPMPSHNPFIGAIRARTRPTVPA